MLSAKASAPEVFSCGNPKPLSVARSMSQTTATRVQQCEAQTVGTTKIYGFVRVQILTSCRPHSYLCRVVYSALEKNPTGCLVLHMVAVSLVFCPLLP